MGILPKEIWVVEEEEDESDETMSKRVEGDYEGVWMDGEDKPTDDIRYNGEGKKNRCMNRKHAEDIFEASKWYISKARS